ncbi:unnamed protein product [Aphanomyces euteiches]
MPPFRSNADGTVANMTMLNATAPTTTPSSSFDFLAFFIKAYQVLQILYSLSYALMFCLTMCLIVYLRRNRTTAYKGDSNAAGKVILPSFEPLFWVVAIFTGSYTAYFTFASLFDYTKPISIGWFSELLVQGREFIFYLIVVFLYQRSVSRPALVRSIGIALFMVIIPVTIAIIFDQTDQSQATSFIVLGSYRGLIMGNFIWLFFRPLSRASVRAQRELCLFAIIYFALVYTYSILFYLGDVKNGFTCVYSTVVWATVGPYFVWRLLKADTEHWRGLSDKACEFQQLFRDKQGMQEIVSAQGLHVLLEMHHKDIIDFAHLEIQRLIAVGASANVYRGMYQSSKQVAVKVYSPTEITEATILEFSQETALCAALKHPNIVRFEGMCICPPSICLVYELCRGNLDDALRKTRSDYTEPLWRKLCFMLDATRAVAYLHSFSPPFIHRDIKPANYLLDANNVVKLTDFGESRSMAFSSEDIANDDRRMTVCGTVDYMAPEVVEGKQGMAEYNETVDIYSLAITLWEILHPGQEKYSLSNRNHVNVFRMVLDGQRPPIDPEVPQTLHDLLENAWNSDPVFRPSAKMVLAVLEDLQEVLCGQIAHSLSTTVVYLPPTKSSKKGPSTSFTGEALVRCLLEHRYAFEVEEAVRFGNSLMDAGCLHHTKHSQQFENSPSTTYTFDSYQLDLNEPIDEMGAIAGGSTLGDGTSYMGTTSILGDVRPLCACRKLGQGHVKPKMPRRKFFGARKDDQAALLTVNLLNETGGDMDFVALPTTTSTSTFGTRKLSAL